MIYNLRNSPQLLMEDKIYEDKVYKVWIEAEINGKNIGHHIVDLQFDQGVPYAILEWQKEHEDVVPAARVWLNHKCLLRLPPKSGKADYLYEIPVVWPE